MASPHEVLRVEPDADEADVQRAYRRRVKETHPDHGGSPEAFQRVRDAYEALRSGEWRSELEPTPAATEPTDAPAHRVEYLDYAAIVDLGWDPEAGDLFERAAAADLDPADHGEVAVGPDETLLAAAERRGFSWPYACRGGACANCAVEVAEGDVEMPASHVLPEEMVEDGVRLSCVGSPTGEPTKVLFNLKHRPDLDDLRLPPNRFDLAKAGD